MAGNKIYEESDYKVYPTPKAFTGATKNLVGSKTSHITPRGYKLGWIPDVPDAINDYKFSVVHATKVETPIRFSLRKNFPYVFNQGSLGSCTANAALLLYGQLRNIRSLKEAFSRLDYYRKERVLEGTVNIDAGAQIRSGIKCLAKQGVVKEKDWPYLVEKFKLAPPRSVALTAAKNKIVTYSRLTTREDFRQCIAAGYGFTYGFACYESLDSDLLARTGIMLMPNPGEKQIGGHAVSAIGYDFDFHNNPIFLKSKMDPSLVSNEMYEVRNSWGNWGDRGNFWMPAQYVENPELSTDFWTMRAAN